MIYYSIFLQPFCIGLHINIVSYMCEGHSFMRKLFSTGIPCQAGCQYCFAKWDKEYYELPSIESEQLNEREAIVYPSCDGEFFDQYKLIDHVKKMAEKMDKIYLSISTKHLISDQEISCISKLNRELISENKGFVKLAISISNKSMLEEIEPGTMPYKERLHLANKIAQEGIFFALTIKPILPFISAEEYGQMIHDFSAYTKYVLIGGLYINRETEFYSRYLKSEHSIQHRRVEWLPGCPEWEYIEDHVQFEKIRTYAKNEKVLLFDSDVDLIKSYINRR